MSQLGPTLAPEDLAGRKLLALFDRAAPRDFVDVYQLVHRYGRELLIERARAVDLGLDLNVLADMMALLDRYEDEDLPIAPTQVGDLRAYFRDWRDSLTA